MAVRVRVVDPHRNMTYIAAVDGENAWRLENGSPPRFPPELTEYLEEQLARAATEGLNAPAAYFPGPTNEMVYAGAMACIYVGTTIPNPPPPNPATDPDGTPRIY